MGIHNLEASFPVVKEHDIVIFIKMSFFAMKDDEKFGLFQQTCDHSIADISH